MSNGIVVYQAPDPCVFRLHYGIIPKDVSDVVFAYDWENRNVLRNKIVAIEKIEGVSLLEVWTALELERKPQVLTAVEFTFDLELERTFQLDSSIGIALDTFPEFLCVPDELMEKYLENPENVGVHKLVAEYVNAMGKNDELCIRLIPNGYYIPARNGHITFDVMADSITISFQQFTCNLSEMISFLSGLLWNGEYTNVDVHLSRLLGIHLHPVS